MTLTGDAGGSTMFSGFSDATISLTLANSGVVAGYYTAATITVDSKGRIIFASNGSSLGVSGTIGQINVANGVVSLATDPIIPGSGGVTLPVGNTAQRPGSAQVGQTRFNTDLSRVEAFNGTNWAQSVPASGNAAQVQFNANGSLGGAAMTAIEPAGNLWLRGNAPSLPVSPADGVVMYADDRIGRAMPAYQDATGFVNRLQPAIATSRLGWFAFIGAGTGTAAMGINITPQGSLTARNVTTTNFFQSVRRMGFTTSNTVGAIAGFRSTGGSQYFRGSVPGMGGFDFTINFGISALTANTACRWATGLTQNTSVLGNVDYTTLQNILIFAANPTDNNVCLYYNNGSSTASVINFDNNYPAKSVANDFYQARLYSPPNGTYVGYSLTNMTTMVTSSGVLATSIPSGSTLLCPQLSLVATAAAVATLDFQQMTIETPY